MQIIFLPKWQMILSYFIVWPLLQIAVAVISNRIGDRHFSPESFWLRTRKWEKGGEFYKRVFKVHKWKRLLPDGARVHKKGFRKKSLNSHDPEYLKAFIAETGRAETIHWLQIAPFWIFGLWSPPIVIWLMLGYALIVNTPCIIAQRYNRPRLIRVYRIALRKSQPKE